MHFNGDKFECPRFWPGSGEPPVFQYKGPDHNDIEVKSDLRDLGVQLSSDLSFELHVEKNCSWSLKANWLGPENFQEEE